MTNGGLKVIDIPNGLRIGDKPPRSGGGNSTVVVPAGIRNKIVDARQKAASGARGANEALLQAQQSLISDQLQRGLITPDVAETVRDVIDKTLNVTPQSWMSWLKREAAPSVPTLSEIIANYANDVDTPTGFTSEEFEQFKDLLANIY
jgi:hypothetical protein